MKNKTCKVELEYGKESIVMEKELNELDELTINISEAIEKTGVKNVVVSGYVSILFGRSRASEDVDFIIEPLTKEKFLEVWNSLKEFECLNTEKKEEAYKEYFSKGIAVRFSKKGEYIPNAEIKKPKNKIEEWVLINRKKAIINNKKIFISPIELQIAYKAFLGSEKDLEDARHLYKLFKEKLDLKKLKKFVGELKAEKNFERHIQ